MTDILRRLKEIDDHQEKRWKEKIKGYQPQGVIPPQAAIAQSWTRPPNCENAELRGVALANAMKDHCPQGHLYDAVDARGYRTCTLCRRHS